MNSNLDDIKRPYFNDTDRNYSNSNVINKKKQSLLNTCFGLSISYLVVWLVWWIFFILLFIISGSFNIIITEVFGVILFILGVILIDKILSLKRYYFRCVRKDLYICFLFWWVLFLPSFIGAIFVINDCIKIKKQNLDNLESINENDFSNSIANKHITLLETCKWCSILLIALWIIYAIVVFSYVFSNDNTLQVDGIIAGGVLLGIILIVLSIVLSIKTIDLYNHFLPFAKGLYFWFLFWIFLWIPCFIGSILTIIQCNKIKKQYKQYIDEALDKKIKKYLTITSTVVSSAMTVLGVGLVAGTYNSYNNYQLLTSIENQVKSMDNNKVNSWMDGRQISSQTRFVSCFSIYDFIKELVVLSKSTDPDCIVWIPQISPYEWNEEIQNLSDFQKENLNNVLQNQKKLFYGNYPLQQDVSWNSIESSANLTNKESYDIYSLQDSVYHLNLNYGANQASLIAGSILIAIGLVSLALLTTYLEITRKKKQNNLLNVCSKK